MVWTEERRAEQSRRMAQWHAARNPERAAARNEERAIAKARKSSVKKPPLDNPFWRALVDLVIARTVSGQSMSEMSLAHVLRTSRIRVVNASRALIKRGYLGTNKHAFTAAPELCALADSDGRPWQRDQHLFRVEERDGVAVKVCPPRHAAGALVWPQKLQRRGA